MFKPGSNGAAGAFPFSNRAPFPSTLANTLVNEMANVVTGSGLALDPTNDGQVAAAINKLVTKAQGTFANGVSGITAATTLTPAQSGNFVNVQADVPVTLPAVQAGLTYSFYCGTHFTLQAFSGASIFLRNTIGTSRRFFSGTTLTVYCDGANWIVVDFAANEEFYAFQSNTTLTAAHAGSTIQVLGNGTAITLPTGGQLPANVVYRFFANSAGNVTIQTANQTDFIYVNPAYIHSITLQPWDTLELLYRGGNEWDIVGGTALLQFLPQFQTPAANDNSGKYASTAWVNQKINTTVTWVGQQGYATTTWVGQQGYAPSTWVTQNYLAKSGDTAHEIYNDGWYRSIGVTGWFNGTYGGGIHMSDSTWIRIYGAKNFTLPGAINFQTDGSIWSAMYGDFGVTFMRRDMGSPIGATTALLRIAGAPSPGTVYSGSELSIYGFGGMSMNGSWRCLDNNSNGSAIGIFQRIA